MSSPSVVILGASNDRTKFGNKSVRAHQRAGYEVFPVNPKAGEIEGLPTYASLAELPVRNYDRLSVYVAPAVGLTLLEGIAALGVDEVWLNPGAQSAELLKRARELGLPVIEGCSIVDLGLSPAQFPD